MVSANPDLCASGAAQTLPAAGRAGPSGGPRVSSAPAVGPALLRGSPAVLSCSICDRHSLWGPFSASRCEVGRGRGHLEGAHQPLAVGRHNWFPFLEPDRCVKGGTYRVYTGAAFRFIIRHSTVISQVGTEQHLQVKIRPPAPRSGLAAPSGARWGLGTAAGFCSPRGSADLDLTRLCPLSPPAWASARRG